MGMLHGLRMVVSLRSYASFHLSSAGTAPRSAIMLIDPDTQKARELSITGIPKTIVNNPVWMSGGKHIAFVTRTGPSGGQVWMVPANGGQATPITKDNAQASAPSFIRDGRRMAYFAPDTAGRVQIWVQSIKDGSTVAGPPIKVTNHNDVTPTRIRWSSDGTELLYSADGRLWKVAASGGKPTAFRSLRNCQSTRPRRELPTARFPEPGQREIARGFTGLALSPDGSRIGMLALGKLWIIPVDGYSTRSCGRSI